MRWGVPCFCKTQLRFCGANGTSRPLERCIRKLSEYWFGMIYSKKTELDSTQAPSFYVFTEQRHFRLMWDSLLSYIQMRSGFYQSAPHLYKTGLLSPILIHIRQPNCIPILSIALLCLQVGRAELFLVFLCLWRYRVKESAIRSCFYLHIPSTAFLAVWDGHDLGHGSHSSLYCRLCCRIRHRAAGQA